MKECSYCGCAEDDAFGCPACLAHEPDDEAEHHEHEWSALVDQGFRQCLAPNCYAVRWPFGQINWHLRDDWTATNDD